MLMTYVALTGYGSFSAFAAHVLNAWMWNRRVPAWKETIGWIVWFLFWPVLVPIFFLVTER